MKWDAIFTPVLVALLSGIILWSLEGLRDDVDGLRAELRHMNDRIDRHLEQHASR